MSRRRTAAARHKQSETFDPVTAWAVYAPGAGGFGTRCIGHIVSRGKTGFEGFNADDKSLGLFATTKSAADIISAASRSSDEGAHRG
jgi:hypothetical protein